LISSLPPISKPQVRTQVEVIDGRSGDIVTPLGFSAYDKPVKIGLTYNYDIDEIIEYFNSSGEVIFSNEPDKVYRYAIYEQIDFEKLIKFKTAEVVLHVQPFKRSANEKPQAFNISTSPATVSIYNAGNIYSRPVITITATGDVALSLNGSEILNIEFGETEQTIIIDCEDMNAYSSQGLLLNRLITGNYDNIRLIKGSNEIGLTGSVSSIVIDKVSRWI
jgi:phage-related protein